MLLDLANPDRYLEVRGLARLEPDDDYAFADRLAAKYGGIDLRQLDGPGEAARRRHDRAGQDLPRRHDRDRRGAA